MLIFNIENTYTYLTSPDNNWTGLETIVDCLTYRINGAHFLDICKKIWCGRKIGNNGQCRRKLILYRNASKHIYKKECRIHGVLENNEAIALWDGKKSLFNDDNKSFPTGLISRTIEALKQLNIYRQNTNQELVVYKIKDHRIKPELGMPYELSGITPRPYQSEIIRLMDKASRGQIELCTRGGKSVLMADWISKHNVPTLICVPRLILLWQLKRDIEKWLGVEVGVVGDGEKNPKRITIATYQSIDSAYKIRKPRKSKAGTKINKKPKKVNKKKIQQDLENQLIRDVVSNVGTIITDEHQFAPANTIQNIQSNAGNAYYKFGLSGTINFEEDGDKGRGLLCQAYTGKKLIEVRPSPLIKEGWLSRPTIKILPVEYDNELKAFVENVGDVRETENKAWIEFYKKAIVDNPTRNMLICKEAIRLVEEEKSNLIAVQIKQHGINLIDILKPIFKDKVRYVNGDEESIVLDKTLEDLDNKKIMCCIATSVFGIGITVNSLDSLIMAKAYKARTDVCQLIGRVLGKTETKNSCEIIDFYDKIKLLEQSSKDRIALYQEEPEYKIIYK